MPAATSLEEVGNDVYPPARSCMRSHGIPFEQMDPESWRKSLRNELDIVYNVCHAAWPYLKEADGSSIIITSSTTACISWALIGMRHSLTKAAVCVRM